MMDVESEINAAYENDRAGREREAIRHYDAAYQLGIPEHHRRRFFVGYGSTLRNVGRVDDAIAILGQAVADDPAYPAFTAFLALALGAAGHPTRGTLLLRTRPSLLRADGRSVDRRRVPSAALAAMLGCALDVARPGAFDGYERALGEYHRELLELEPTK